MKYFAFLQTIIFLVPIFQPKINLLTFKNQIWLTILRGLWPKKKLSDIFFWRSPNLEKFTHEIVARRRIAIWGLRSARIKKLKKTDPHFFWKIMGVCFLQLFDPSTPKASNRDPTSRDYFTHKFFKIWAP